MEAKVSEMVSGEKPQELSTLPIGWVLTSVGYIADLIRGVSYPREESSKEAQNGYVPILRANNIDGELNFKDLVYVLQKRVKHEQFVRAFDIIIAMSSGSKDLVGKASQAKFAFEGGFGAFCGLVRVTPALDRKLVGFFFQSSIYRKQVSLLSSGVNINNLRRSHIDLMPIPFPPLPEQHRIVAKIEELFTRLDAGVDALKKIKTQLKRYRQAVLRDAFEGKLTEEWRKAHKGELEPASVLLERIKEERRKNTKGKYKELPPLDTSDLPELPEGWMWIRVGAVSEVIQYGTSEKTSKDHSGIPVLRMGNILDGKLVFKDLKHFPVDWPQLNKYILRDGDVLFNRTNSAELVGKTAVYKRCHPAALFASYLIRVKVNKKAYIPDLLSFFINSITGRQYIASVVSQQVGQANVNGTKLSLMPIPLPLFTEQHKIVEEIERRLSIADEIEKTVDLSLKQAGRLRQSILKRAFEGKLVPQDPSDEPAGKLLERIMEEKSKQQAKTKTPERTR